MSKQISLSQDMVAIVDDSDYEWLMQWKWHARKSKSRWYAAKHIKDHKNGVRKLVRMHHAIVGYPLCGCYIDHINQNSLDNRRSNLRVVTPTANNLNKSNSAPFPYVYRCGDRYLVQVRFGLFDTLEDAAMIAKQVMAFRDELLYPSPTIEGS